MKWSLRILVLLVVSVLILASCSSGDSESVFDVKPGDCFDDVIEDGELAEEIVAVPMVDCEDPHDNEAYAAFDVPGDAYPGTAGLDDEAVAKCLPLFEDYVGSTYETSRLDIMFLYPLEDGWGEGDREITCVLFDVDLQKLTGSMRGSGE